MVCGVVLLIASVLGVAMTLLTLPGAWVIVATAAGLAVWQPGVISWWTIGLCAVLAGAGEVAEVAATGAGAARGGASRAGMFGAIVGTLVGAVVGILIPPPIVGSLIAAAAGAALGAAGMERVWHRRAWGESAKAGAGAAAGRLAAVVIKAIVAGGVGLVLTVAAFWP